MNLATTKFPFIHEFKRRGITRRYVRRYGQKIALKADPIASPETFRGEYRAALASIKSPTQEVAPAIALIDELARIMRGGPMEMRAKDMNPDGGYTCGWVYFIEAAGLGLVKIGWANDPRRRLLDLLDGSPVDLRLITARPGGRSSEATTHKIYQAYRTGRGEWFRHEGDLADHVTAVLGEYGPEPWFGEAGFKLRVRAIERRLASPPS